VPNHSDDGPNAARVDIGDIFTFSRNGFTAMSDPLFQLELSCLPVFRARTEACSSGIIEDDLGFGLGFGFFRGDLP
jgi:hypothetical protein